jgi:hypothetical protein
MLGHITMRFNELLLWDVNACVKQLFEVSVLLLPDAG